MRSGIRRTGDTTQASIAEIWKRASKTPLFDQTKPSSSQFSICELFSCFVGGRTRFCFRIWESFAGSVSVFNQIYGRRRRSPQSVQDVRDSGKHDHSRHGTGSALLCGMNLTTLARRRRSSFFSFHNLFEKLPSSAGAFFKNSLVNFSNAIEKR